MRGFKIFDSQGRLKTTADPPGFVIGTNVEAWDADLDAVAALASSGVVCRTAANTFTTRVITGSAGLTVTDGGGITGAPTIGFDANHAIVITGPITVTDAEWKSLSSAPKTLIAAPGANLAIMPLKLFVYSNLTAVYSVARTGTLRWSGSSAPEITSGLAFTNATGAHWNAGLSLDPTTVTTGAIAINTAVVFRHGGDVTLGDVANVFKVWVMYHVLNVA